MSTRTSFSEVDLHPDLRRGIAELGFTHCTEVQQETFVHTLQGRDVAVQSQTGTGKTAAFLISIFHLLNTNDKYKDAKALIVAPTRELAVQIEDDAKGLGKYLSQKTACFYGGVGYGQQEAAIANGVDIIIGTPGRLLDFNQSGKLDFRQVGVLVIDEADRLFDMGFYPDIRRLMRNSRPREERLTMLYSATLSVRVRNIAWQFMNSPAEVEIDPEQMTVDKVDQRLYHVAKDEKMALLLGVLKQENPGTALIFCNTKRATELVAKKLQLNGYACEFLSGDLPQKKRLRIIDSVKEGKITMLCATDVAARGLHVEDLDLVVNYDIPEDPEAYVHRIGRTARAGKEGRAVSLACERFVLGLEPIEELIGMRIPSERVTDELLAEDHSLGHHISLNYGDRPPRGDGRSRSGRPQRSSNQSHRGGRPSGGRPGGRPSGGSGHQHHSKDHRQDHSESHRRPRVDGPKHAARDARGTRDESRKHHHSDAGGRDRNRQQGNRQQVAAEASPSRSSSMDDRIAYYKRKYGEDFELTGAGASGSGKKTGKPASQGKPAAHAKPAQKKQDQNEQNDQEKGTSKGLIGRLKGLIKKES